MSRRLRRFWLVLHRWLGLTAGLLFAVMGLSGSLLVFHHAIDESLHPELLLSAPGEPSRSFTDVVTAAETYLSEPSARAEFVDPPRSDRGVWTVWFRTAPDGEAPFTQVYVDPHTAAVTGHRVWGEYFVTWLYRLHDQLLAGPRGETIIGISGLVMMVSVCSGLYLWWPLWRHSWRAALAVRYGDYLNYDLHKTVGVVSSSLLLVAAFTGVYLVFPEWIKPCVAVVSTESAPGAEQLRSNPQSGLTRIDPDQAAAVARAVFPEAQLKRLYLPSKAEGVYVARVRQPGEVRRSSGNSRVWMDQYSGEVLAVRDWDTRTAADTFFAWQFPLHNGEAFGLAGRGVLFLTGLTPGLLYVTGIVLWWRRRRSRQRQALRGKTSADAEFAPGQGRRRRLERVPGGRKEATNDT